MIYEIERLDEGYILTRGSSMRNKRIACKTIGEVLSLIHDLESKDDCSTA